MYGTLNVQQINRWQHQTHGKNPHTRSNDNFKLLFAPKTAQSKGKIEKRKKKCRLSLETSVYSIFWMLFMFRINNKKTWSEWGQGFFLQIVYRHLNTRLLLNRIVSTAIENIMFVWIECREGRRLIPHPKETRRNIIEYFVTCSAKATHEMCHSLALDSIWCYAVVPGTTNIQRQQQ